MTDDERDDAAPDPDVLPEDAPRGAPTIPNPGAQTGGMTPPTTGWGETLAGEERPHDEPPGEPTEE